MLAAAGSSGTAPDNAMMPGIATRGGLVSSATALSPLGAPDDATPDSQFKQRPSTAKDAEAAYAASAKLPGAPPSALREETKMVSFGFLRDRRDINGRRPGEDGYDRTTLQVRLARDERFTPGQEQYWQIKKHHADCIIAFKLGKFYELFEEDALIGHRGPPTQLASRDVSRATAAPPPDLRSI